MLLMSSLGPPPAQHGSTLPPWLAPSAAPSGTAQPRGSKCRQWWPADAFGQQAGEALCSSEETLTTLDHQQSDALPEDPEESLETLTALCTPADGAAAAAVGDSTVELADKKASSDAVLVLPNNTNGVLLDRADTSDSALLPILGEGPPKQVQPLPEEPGGTKVIIHHTGAGVGEGAGQGAGLVVCAGQAGATALVAAVNEDVADVPLVSKRTNAILDIMSGRPPLNKPIGGSPMRAAAAQQQHKLPFLLQSSIPAASSSSISTVFPPTTAGLGATTSASDPSAGSPEPCRSLAASTMCMSDASASPGLAAASAPCGTPSGATHIASSGLVSTVSPCAASPAAAPRLLYVGVFLTPESREVLLSMVPPLHPALLRGDHMTLVYRPSLAQLLQYPLGAQVDLRVLGSAADARVQAVFVEAPAWLETASACAHITISVAAGAKAVEAGALLQGALQQAALASAADLAYAPAGSLGAYQHFPEALPLVGRLGVRLAVPTATAVSMGWASAGGVAGPEAEVIVFSVDELAQSGCFGIDTGALAGFHKQFDRFISKQDPFPLTLSLPGPEADTSVFDAVSSGCATPDASVQLLSSSVTPATSNSPWLPAGSALATRPLESSALKVAASPTRHGHASAAVAGAGAACNSPPVGYGSFGAAASPLAASPPTGGLAALLASAAGSSSSNSAPLPSCSPPSGGGLAALLSGTQSRPVSAGGGLAALLSAAAGGSSGSPVAQAAADSAAGAVSPLSPYSPSRPFAAAGVSVDTPAAGALAAAAEEAEEGADSPRSARSCGSASSGSSLDAVQFLSAVHVGDYVAVRPFVPTEGNERLLQGYVREFAAEEPFQADGVLVVLTDNTIGYVTAVIDSQARSGSQGGGGGSSSAAAQRSPGKAGSGSSKGRKASSKAARGLGGMAAAAEGPALASAHSGSALDPLQQWMLDAEAAAAPQLLEPEMRRRDAHTAQRDMQLWQEFEALQQELGEELCSTILDSCSHDFAEAIELIKGQAGRLAGSSSCPSSPSRVPPAAVNPAAAAPAHPAPAAAADDDNEGLLSQLALSLGLLPQDALQLASIVPDLPAEAVVQELQKHKGDVGAAADALLSSQAREAASPAAPSSPSSAGAGSPAAVGCGIAAGMDRHVTQAFIAGQDPARVADARRLGDMAPGALTIELAVMLLEEHNGNLHEAALALSDSQEQEVLARSAAAAASFPGSSTAAAASMAGQAGSSLAAMQDMSEADQLAILAAMGEFEPAEPQQTTPQQPPQQQQQQEPRSRPQSARQQAPQSPVRSAPVYATSPPKQQHRAPAPAAAPGPSHFSAGAGGYSYGFVPPPPPPPPPPSRRDAVVQDFVHLEAQRAALADAKEATDKLYKDYEKNKLAADVMFTAAQNKLNEGDRAGYDELRAQGVELRRQARLAHEQAQRIAWAANNSARTNAWEVDLHSLSVTKAVAKFASQFNCLRGMNHPGGVVMRVITGKGLHSEGNIPKIKLGIQQFLAEQAEAEAAANGGAPWGITWEVDPVNQGIINVHIPADGAGSDAE